MWLGCTRSPSQLQQQLFDFHGLYCLTFCQSRCKCTGIVVALHQIAYQLQQQLFDFHDLYHLTFCQSGTSANIVVALRQIPCQIQQQLFDFHGINCLTFCQSGCKHWPYGWATPTPCSTPSSTVSSTGKPHHHYKQYIKKTSCLGKKHFFNKWHQMLKRVRYF
jgi:hypothetical protein